MPIKFDYSTACIYKLYVDDHPHVYIGSTTLPLETRLSLHKSQFKRYNNGNHNYITSFEIFKLNDNVKIEKIKDCSHVSNTEDLHRVEGDCIRSQINSVNRIVSGRTRREWREDMKDELKKKRSDWYERHGRAFMQSYYQKNRTVRLDYQRRYNMRKKGILVVD